MLKALNQKGDGYNVEQICNNIGSKRIAKLLTESLEDYVQLYNSNNNVKEDGFNPENLLEKFENRLDDLLIKFEKIQKNTPKNWKKEKKTSNIYSLLKERIHKLTVLK